MTATGYAESSAAARTPVLFGRVMALVAVTVGLATLGVWVARGWGGAGWFIAWLLSLGCLVGLNVAAALTRRVLCSLIEAQDGLPRTPRRALGRERTRPARPQTCEPEVHWIARSACRR